jgi:parvulin-like peptidyl-prolyl isomerase
MAPNKTNAHNKKHVAHLEQVRRQIKLVQYSAFAIIAIVIGLVIYGILDSTVLINIRSVASVNGENISGGNFIARVKLARIQLINQYSQIMQFAKYFGVDPSTDPTFAGQINQIQAQLGNTELLGGSIVDQMIDEALIRQEAEKRGIAVSAEEIDARLQEMYGYMPNGTATPTITPTEPILPTANATSLAIVTITPTASAIPTETLAPTATLDLTTTPTATTPPTATATFPPTSTDLPATATATPYTLEGYQEALKTNIDALTEQTGIDEAALRALLESEILREKLAASVTADLQPFEDQVWARHILVADEPAALIVYDRLMKGEDFAVLAAEFGTDGTKDTGGDLGWFGRGQMDADFENAVYALSIGEISQPVKTQFGYHIIQVIGHEERPLNGDQFAQFKNTAFTEFLTTLREAATIENYTDFWTKIVPTEPALQ